MPATALQHFDEDISRARAILVHAKSLSINSEPDPLLRADLCRSAWMFAVGALDAYFCDACTDIVAAALSSKSRQSNITLPEFFYGIEVPVRAVLEPYTNQNRRWRMAARKMMEKENVLRLQVIKDLFNKFFRKNFKFFNELLDSWMNHPEAKTRLFGVTAATYRGMTPAEKDRSRKDAMEKLEGRFEDIFQCRNDCVHNCDRPKMRPQELRGSSTVLKVIEDIEVLVHRCDEHIDIEFREFLRAAGCTTATIAAAGY